MATTPPPPPPRPTPERVWLRLIRLMTRARVTMTERLGAIALSVPQLDVLSTLTEAEGVSQQELATRLYVTKGNISGLLDRLADAGLVERRAIPADKRSHAIHLTGEGRRLAELGMAIQAHFIAETFGRLSGDELTRFDGLVGATRDLMRADAARHQAGEAAARKRSKSAGKAAMSSST